MNGFELAAFIAACYTINSIVEIIFPDNKDNRKE